jgi:hypothetical protein
MLRVVRRFDKHFTCHLQGGYVSVGPFRLPDVGPGSGRGVGCGGADWRSGLLSPPRKPRWEIVSEVDFGEIKYWGVNWI